MDVVKGSIDRVKGNLIIHSEVGRGTEMHLQLPLSLTVITGLVFECGDQVYLSPRLCFGSPATFPGRHSSRGWTRGGKGREQNPPAVLPGRDFGEPAATRQRLTALVLHFQERQAAFVVKTASGQELVVRGLGIQLKRVEFFSGATILGDGSPALILSVVDLFGEGAIGSVRGETAGSGQGRPKGRVLVVDDSITTRTMERISWKPMVVRSR